MKAIYWVIKHEHAALDLYLGKGRRWQRFEHALHFRTKSAAELVVDTFCPGAVVVDVVDMDPDTVIQHLVEGGRVMPVESTAKKDSERWLSDPKVREVLQRRHRQQSINLDLGATDHLLQEQLA